MKPLFVLFALVVVVAAMSGTELGNIVSGQSIELESANPAVSETDLPTLPITVTDGGFWTRPEVPAGRYRVLVDNLTDRDVDLDFIELPEEWTAERVQTAVRWDASVATSGSGPGVVPTQEFVPLQFAGSAAAKRHSTGHAVIELVPGQWIVTSLGAGPGSAYAAIRVTPAQSLESVLAETGTIRFATVHAQTFRVDG